MNLYEKQILERNKKALEYYYKNREQILQKNKKKKIYTNQYYKEWYQKNKEELNRRRRKNSKKNQGYEPYKNTIKESKQLSFILFG